MKKTLLIAAAALAAGIISTQAQTVYSQNVVGYYNVPIAAGKYAMVGNQLTNSTGVGISQVFTSGLFSDPNGVTNSVIWLWNSGASQYAPFQYFTEADAVNYLLANPGQGNGFYDANGVLQNQPFGPGQAAFIQNPSAASVTVTLTGNVSTGTNVTTLVQGYSMVCSAVPIATNMCSALGFVGHSDPNGVNNDVIWIWNSGASQYAPFQYFTEADAVNYLLANPGQGDGFYDSNGVNQNYAPNVGTGFFLQHIVAGSEKWTNILNLP